MGSLDGKKKAKLVWSIHENVHLQIEKKNEHMIIRLIKEKDV